MSDRGSKKVDILSFSLQPDLASEVDRVMEDMGYQNRSEVIRDALRLFLEKHEDLHRMEGEVEGVALVLYAHRAEKAVHAILHESPDVFRSFLHLDFGEERGKCCDVVQVRSDSPRIREAFHAIESTPHVEKVNFTPL
ncbi:MAG: CopG family ribbon-helix-helix protein [Thermoplasmata archaeon]|nr:CopG family ribbon-helix-helix protein [Thermoplasmata archaeon]